jgi:hypothetical protein
MHGNPYIQHLHKQIIWKLWFPLPTHTWVTLNETKIHQLKGVQKHHTWQSLNMVKLILFLQEQQNKATLITSQTKFNINGSINPKQ